MGLEGRAAHTAPPGRPSRKQRRPRAATVTARKGCIRQGAKPYGRDRLSLSEDERARFTRTRCAQSARRRHFADEVPCGYAEAPGVVDDISFRDRKTSNRRSCPFRPANDCPARISRKLGLETAARWFRGTGQPTHLHSLRLAAAQPRFCTLSISCAIPWADTGLRK